tara:strand:- start:511 stop:642 length:132 start_codon:yes stop_codon:yes gene_type:complete
MFWGLSGELLLNLGIIMRGIVLSFAVLDIGTRQNSFVISANGV